MTTDYNSGQIGGPGNPIEISGTIYAPTYARPALTGNREGNLYKSTDNGLTWTSHAIMYTAITMDYEEPNIVNNGDGLCIALLRSDTQQWTRTIYSPIENMFSSRNSWNASLQVDAYQSIGKNGVCATPSGLYRPDVMLQPGAQLWLTLLIVVRIGRRHLWMLELARMSMVSFSIIRLMLKS
jgi:hypothetical protein